MSPFLRDYGEIVSLVTRGKSTFIITAPKYVHSFQRPPVPSTFSKENHARKTKYSIYIHFRQKNPIKLSFLHKYIMIT